MTAPAVPERVDGFGLYSFSVSPVHRPRSVPELVETLARLRAEGAPVVFRGAGRSYGPVATNPSGPVVEMTGLNRILSFDDAAGVVRAEAGATIGDVWRHALPRGFWPPVVTGTEHVTLGAAVAANVHGKNHWKRGSFAEHVPEVTVLDGDGSPRRLRPEEPGMARVVGGWGEGGPVVEVALRLKPVRTGYLDVEGFALGSLDETLRCLEEGKEDWEYQVAWVDCFPSGAALGRSVVHRANHSAEPGKGGAGLDLATQSLGTRVAGVVPKALVSRLLGLFTSDPGMRWVNLGKLLATRAGGTRRYRQTLAAFNFLLDSLPDWRNAYLPGGFIQYQVFVPKESAREVLAEAIRLQHEAGAVSYLGVLKRHRSDRFPNAYAPDGWSLALDFPVTRRGAPRLIRLCRRLDELVSRSGGGVYRAKDCVGSWERRIANRIYTREF
ncbi:FAD-binding oxidoreductase [Acidobacteria bacterium ACD]|nr:MAG: FAD-binding oxidoreductase [Acidobacteriota bacterium]MCE7958431.1 FAD-binding oxidoreductase [Acidobacteria bacterium ACB2]MDL1948579.1 FAD-binding oxidoreductase [Acidobacteria bacterium ACD]